MINTDKYWENRYKEGGNSGKGSYGICAEFKSSTINSFVKDNGIVSVVDFGCGDGNQLKYFNFKKYIGYDVSKTIIEKCRNLFKNDNTKSFELMGNYIPQQYDLSLSLDVIYHLVDDNDYINYIKILFNSSKKYVIIFSSNRDEEYLNSSHIKNRRFEDWINYNIQHFKLKTKIKNELKGSDADFYIYEKIK